MCHIWCNGRFIRYGEEAWNEIDIAQRSLINVNDLEYPWK